MRFKGTILSVGAHPDDHDFSWGGYLAEAALAGYRVICVVLTRGEKGKIDRASWTAPTGHVRTSEQLVAATILGIHECIFWDFPDGNCHSVPERIAIGMLAKNMRRYKPVTVITYGRDGLTGHPDHVYASRVTTAAHKLVAMPGSKLLHYAATAEWVSSTHEPLIVAGAMTERNRPIVVPRKLLAVSRRLPTELLDLKIGAVHAHATQVAHLATFLGQDLEPLDDWFANEAFVRVA